MADAQNSLNNLLPKDDGLVGATDSGLTVTTDQADYAPGSTATFTANGFTPGSTIRFAVQDAPEDSGDDGEVDIYQPFYVTDGGAGDLDGIANGQVVTTWVVPTDNNGTGTGTPDALNATLQLTATGSNGQVATTTFTDSVPTDATVNLTSLGNNGQINGAFFSNAAYGAGTGVIDPFVRVQKNVSEQGYNSSATASSPDPQFDETGKYGSQYNKALPLSAIPIAYFYNPTTQTFDAYREFRLDINENSNAQGEQYLSLDALQIYQSTSSTLYNFTGGPTSTGTFTGGTSSLRYNLDASGSSNWVALNYDLQPGSGVGDVSVFVPDSAFDKTQQYVYVYSAFGFQPEQNGYLWGSSDGFEEWSVGVGKPIAASDLKGSKFFDANGDGIFNTGDKAWTPSNGFNTPVTVYLDQNQNGVLNWTDGSGGGTVNGVWDPGEGERWTTTDSNGNYTFTNLAAGLGAASTYYVRELVPTGYTQTAPLNGSYPTGVNSENATVSNFVITTEIKTAGVTYNLPAFGNRVNYVPGINVVKYVNGQDANSPTGPVVKVGDTLNFSYVVTNTGNTALSNISVSDDKLGSITSYTGDADNDGLLDTNETWTFTKTATAQAGQVTNIGTVTGKDPLNTTVTDDDPANYFGVSSGINVVKYVNGQDANSPTGPVVKVGDTLNFSYVVTNTGNTALSNISVSDDKLGSITSYTGDADNDGLLDTNETWTFTKTATAQAGQVTNIGTVTGKDPLNTTVTDDDPANYFGLAVSGPGVGTPGFWKQWTAVWDGNTSNDSTFNTRANFPKADILLKDAAGNSRNLPTDPVTGVASSKGILIGDWNFDGLTNNGEKTIFYTVAEAQDILNASTSKENQDARYILDKQLIASWLNVLAGNTYDTSFANASVKQDITNGVIWLQNATPDENGDNVGDGSLTSNSKLPSSNSRWSTPLGNPSSGGGRFYGSQIKDVLDYYNNTGAGFAIDRDTNAISGSLTTLASLQAYQPYF